jgi:hypothetical protein
LIAKLDDAGDLGALPSPEDGMKHKDVIFGLEKVEATPMRNGGSGAGLYNPHTSTFYLTTTLSTGYAECTVGLGHLGAACNPPRRSLDHGR